MPLRLLALLAVLTVGCGPAAEAVPAAPAASAPPSAIGRVTDRPPAPTSPAPPAPPTASPTSSFSRSPPGPPGLPASLLGAEWTRLPTERRVVALTFDAGGDAAGARAILDALAKAGARATFFLTGRWVEVYPDLAREMAARHELGNHTYSHPRLSALADEAVRAELERGATVIRAATGADPRPLFRFPYGDRDARVLRIVNASGYGAIRWTVDTLGWMGKGEGRSTETVRERVLGALGPGEIALMHVGGATDRTTLDADALPALIDAIRARGYDLVRVGDLVRG